MHGFFSTLLSGVLVNPGGSSPKDVDWLTMWRDLDPGQIPRDPRKRAN